MMPCEMPVLSKSKRRKIRERNVTARKAVENTKGFLAAVPFIGCLSASPAVSKSSFDSIVMEGLRNIEQKLEIIWNCLQPFPYQSCNSPPPYYIGPGDTPFSAAEDAVNDEDLHADLFAKTYESKQDIFADELLVEVPEPIMSEESIPVVVAPEIDKHTFLAYGHVQLRMDCEMQNIGLSAVHVEDQLAKTQDMESQLNRPLMLWRPSSQPFIAKSSNTQEELEQEAAILIQRWYRECKRFSDCGELRIDADNSSKGSEDDNDAEQTAVIRAFMHSIDSNNYANVSLQGGENLWTGEEILQWIDQTLDKATQAPDKTGSATTIWVEWDLAQKFVPLGLRKRIVNTIDSKMQAKGYPSLRELVS